MSQRNLKRYKKNMKKAFLDTVNPRIIINLVLYKFPAAVYLYSNTMTKILLK